MANIKKYFISFLYILGLIFVLTLVLTVLNYFDVINGNVLNILKIVITILSTFVGGFLVGKNSNEKGYLEGIKLALIYVVFIFLLSILGFSDKITLNTFLYYAIIILSTMLGGMFGINKKVISE